MALVHGSFKVNQYVPPCFVIPAATCEMMRERNNQTRCDPSTGLFEPVQCRRMPGNRTVTCYCVNFSNGVTIRDSLTVVTDRDDLPDCGEMSKCKHVIM